MWKQVVSPDVLFARSRFAQTESPTGSKNKDNKVKFKIFF